MAGRGMAAASGVYLALLPWEMVVAGLVIAIGILVKNSGIATTLGMASVPAVAAWQGQPPAFVAMGVVIFGLLMVRRLEGVGEVVRSGVPAPRAVLYRCLLDDAFPPGEGELAPSSPDPSRTVGSGHAHGGQSTAASVADGKRILAVADRVLVRRAGNDVVVVVSAMGDTTDGCSPWRTASRPQPARAGPAADGRWRIAMSLLAIAITTPAFRPRRPGSQAGIITDVARAGESSTSGRGGSKGARPRERRHRGRVPGVSTQQDVTTLGRGGSDDGRGAGRALGATSAGSTDVDGVYGRSACRDGGRSSSRSYEEMLESGRGWRQVLQLRSVEYARRHGVRLRPLLVLGQPGMGGQEDERMEQA
jgi:hypothetical protein